MIFLLRIMKYDGCGHSTVEVEKEIYMPKLKFSDENHINLDIKSVKGDENTFILEVGNVVESLH